MQDKAVDTASRTSLFKGLSSLLPLCLRLALALCMDLVGSFLLPVWGEAAFVFIPGCVDG